MNLRTLLLSMAGAGGLCGQPAAISVTTYPASGLAIARGPDGAMWFTESGSIGRITASGTINKFPLPPPAADAWAITAGPDGAMWFTQRDLSRIGRISPAGVAQFYALADGRMPGSIAAGPDGALWFTEFRDRIGRITTGGVITEFTLPPCGATCTPHPNFITAGPDGAMWFTNLGDGFLWRMTTDGVPTKQQQFPTYGVQPSGITLGSDGALWFGGISTVQNPASWIGRFPPGGSLSAYQTPGSAPYAITGGADGALWYVPTDARKIGRVTTMGQITEYELPASPQGYAFSIAADYGGLWVAKTSQLMRVVACSLSATASGTAFSAAGGNATFNIAVNAAGCGWAITGVPWWVAVSQVSGSGPTSVSFTVQPNTGEARTAVVTVAGVAINIAQAAPPCAVTAEVSAGSFPASGGRGVVRVSANLAGCLWTVTNLSAWISTVVTGGSGGGQSFDFTVAPNAGPARSATIAIGQSSITLSQSGPQISASGLRFVALPPCRMVDTRSGGAKTGAFGPPMLATAQGRTIPVPTSGCGVPASALAYAVNVTVVPLGPLGYLTIWPSGQPQPFVSTLNAFQGEVVANAAIVLAGVGGAVDVYASNSTHLIVDINGYFTDQPVADLLFYPVTPCRVIDTRGGQGMPAGFGPPSLEAASQRSFALASGRCGIPARVRAYSLNLTVVPHGPLAYLSAWPSGQTRPLVSVLNSFDGRVAANAAIVPAGLASAIDIYASNRTDVIADINGYFAPDDGAGLYFFPANPCRAVDTRPGQGTAAQFGPPSMLAGESRVFPLPLSRCALPANAAAWSANVTVVPAGVLSYLAMGPDGAPVPFVSTLNSFDGRVVANATITAAGNAGGIQIYTTDRSDVILDLNGWFRR